MSLALKKLSALVAIGWLETARAASVVSSLRAGSDHNASEAGTLAVIPL